MCDNKINKINKEELLDDILTLHFIYKDSIEDISQNLHIDILIIKEMLKPFINEKYTSTEEQLSFFCAH